MNGQLASQQQASWEALVAAATTRSLAPTSPPAPTSSPTPAPLNCAGSNVALSFSQNVVKEFVQPLCSQAAKTGQQVTRTWPLGCGVQMSASSWALFEIQRDGATPYCQQSYVPKPVYVDTCVSAFNTVIGCKSLLLPRALAPQSARLIQKFESMLTMGQQAAQRGDGPLSTVFNTASALYLPTEPNAWEYPDRFVLQAASVAKPSMGLSRIRHIICLAGISAFILFLNSLLLISNLSSGRLA